MGKLTLSFLLIFSIHAYKLDNVNQVESVEVDNILENQKLLNFKVKVEHVTNNYDELLKDPQNRVSPVFDVPDYFRSKVRFWFKIYTQFDSSKSVVHDSKDLGIIYDVLIFDELKNSGLSKHVKFSLQRKFIKQKVKEYKKALVNIANEKKPTPLEKEILVSLKESKVKVPTEAKKRKTFFLKLSKTLRAQTGQKDSIQNGLNNFSYFSENIHAYFEKFDVPKELMAIPFLESSFNTSARSKVGAAGVWQFMRFIGKHFMRINKRVDQRINPVIATVSALHLLKQNYKILKSWDLAITAYNSGTKHLIRARRKLKGKFKKIDLPTILQNYKHKHLGFASQNFYAEFLALVYSLAYQERFFKKKESIDHFLYTYVNKRPISPRKYFNLLKKSYPNIKKYNTHFNRRYIKRNAPKGSVFISPTKLSSKKYRLISIGDMKRRYPKNWWKLAR